MKIHINDEMRENGLLGKMLLHCITYHSDSNVKHDIISKTHLVGFDGFFDVKLMVDDKEMELVSFMARLNENIKRSINEGVQKRISSDIDAEMYCIVDSLSLFKEEIRELVSRKFESVEESLGDKTVENMTLQELYGLQKDCGDQIQRLKSNATV